MVPQGLHVCEYCRKSFATTKELQCVQPFPVKELTDFLTLVDTIILILALTSVINVSRDLRSEVDLIAIRTYTQTSGRSTNVLRQIVNTKVHGKIIFEGTEKKTTRTTMIGSVTSN